MLQTCLQNKGKIANKNDLFANMMKKYSSKTCKQERRPLKVRSRFRLIPQRMNSSAKSLDFLHKEADMPGFFFAVHSRKEEIYENRNSNDE